MVCYPRALRWRFLSPRPTQPRLRGFAAVCAVAVFVTFFLDAAAAQTSLFGGNRNEVSELTARMVEMEERMRLMTGQMEELSFQVRTLQDQIRRMAEDNEYRLQQLEQSTGRPRGDVGADAIPGASVQGSARGQSGSGDEGWAASGGYDTAGTLDGQVSQNPALGGEGTLPQDGRPLDLSALAGGLLNNDDPAARGAGAASPALNHGGTTPPDVASASPGATRTAVPDGFYTGLTGTPEVDYSSAYDEYARGAYAIAETRFEAFLNRYPQHPLAVDAQFFLAESQYQQGRFRDAAELYLSTYTDHPQSPRGAQSLLKLGMSLQNVGERDAACATYAELIDKFPSAAPALLDRAAAERQRANCA